MDGLNFPVITHICTAVGTATTMAGILLSRRETIQLIAVPVIKGMTDLHERIAYLTEGKITQGFSIFQDYHFGGYAKKTTALLDFMNHFYKTHGIPTDFVYTAKLMYGITDQIKKGYFPPGSTVLCLHTGGLQGNNSIQKSSLIF